MNPVKGKMCLPLDCADWQAIEWSDEPVTVTVPRPKRSFKDFERTVAAVQLPDPVQFKSLAETLNDLVLRVRGRKHPLAAFVQ